MRVLIGSTWYEPTVDTPMLIELSQKDKDNIKNMPEGATRYGLFHDDTPLNVSERLKWMHTDMPQPEDKPAQ